MYDDPSEGRTAFLQVRAQGDSFPGCVEKTWGGGAEDGEPLSQAICREYREELAEVLRRALGDAPVPDALAALQKTETAADPETADTADEHPGAYALRRLNILREEGKKLIVTLLCEIRDPALAQALQPLVERGVLLALRSEDLPRLEPINRDHKKDGLPKELREQGKLGMFPDEIEAVRSALETPGA